MLVLTRRAGQGLRIGEGIELQVLRIEGDRVVLGVVAPRTVTVTRAELHDEVSRAVRQAAAGTDELRKFLKSPA